MMSMLQAEWADIFQEVFQSVARNISRFRKEKPSDTRLPMRQRCLNQ